MPRVKGSVLTKDTYLEMLVKEKIRLGHNALDEDKMEYLMNINRALSSYTEDEIRKMKTLIESKHNTR